MVAGVLRCCLRGTRPFLAALAVVGVVFFLVATPLAGRSEDAAEAVEAVAVPQQQGQRALLTSANGKKAQINNNNINNNNNNNNSDNDNDNNALQANAESDKVSYVLSSLVSQSLRQAHCISSSIFNEISITLSMDIDSR